MSVKTKNFQFSCPECNNDTQLTNKYQDGDVVECDYCGIEFELTVDPEDKEYLLQIK